MLLLREHPELKDRAVKWYSSKWGIPPSAYEESISDCIEHPDGIPQWYLMVDDGGRIIAGCGAIANDFHKRKDLSPNVCAVYVEPDMRKRGLARIMLDAVCADLALLGVRDAYLTTDHTEFYERCGWNFYCMVEEEGGGTARLYHKGLKA